MNTESFLVIVAPLLLFIFGVIMIPKVFKNEEFIN